jgi:hypothetical protein
MEQTIFAPIAPAYFRFREEIEGALDSRTHTIQWLDAQVWSGRAQVWGRDDAVLLSEIRQFPTGAFEVHVLVAAGNRDTLVNDTISEVEQWAGDIGALFVTIASRAAWARVLRGRGYQHWQTEIRKVM